jgi:hypothetical protein
MKVTHGTCSCPQHTQSPPYNLTQSRSKTAANTQQVHKAAVACCPLAPRPLFALSTRWHLPIPQPAGRPAKALTAAAEEAAGLLGSDAEGSGDGNLPPTNPLSPPASGRHPIGLGRWGHETSASVPPPKRKWVRPMLHPHNGTCCPPSRSRLSAGCYRTGMQHLASAAPAAAASILHTSGSDVYMLYFTCCAARCRAGRRGVLPS